jgi:hypothetical protein
MIRSGIAQEIAMRISGHKTASVFARYNIIDATDLLDAREENRGRRANQGKKRA